MPHLHAILDSTPKCAVLSSPFRFILLPTGWQCSIPASYGSVLLATDWETSDVIRLTDTQLQKEYAMLRNTLLCVMINSSEALI